MLEFANAVLKKVGNSTHPLVRTHYLEKRKRKKRKRN